VDFEDILQTVEEWLPDQPPDFVVISFRIGIQGSSIWIQEFFDRIFYRGGGKSYGTVLLAK